MYKLILKRSIDYLYHFYCCRYCSNALFEGDKKLHPFSQSINQSIHWLCGELVNQSVGQSVSQLNDINVHSKTDR